MIDGLRVLAVVVGRGGSKGLPRKNVLPLLGTPVIAWTVKAAKQSRYLDRVVVSSDDEEIIQAAVAAGAEAPFRRPAELATDTVTVNPVIIHALDALDEHFDLVVLLQASSPLRTAEDIDACIEKLITTGAPTCLSVHETAAPPHQTFTMEPAGNLKTVIGERLGDFRRQELPDTYQLNGAVSVLRVDWFREHLALWVPETVGCEIPFARAIDIDNKTDFDLAEFFAGRLDQA